MKETYKKRCPKCNSDSLVMLYWNMIECLNCNKYFEWQEKWLK